MGTPYYLWVGRWKSLVLILCIWAPLNSKMTVVCGHPPRYSGDYHKMVTGKRQPNSPLNKLLKHSPHPRHHRNLGVIDWNITYTCNWTTEVSFKNDPSTFLDGRKLVLGLGPFKPFAYVEGNDTSALAIGDYASNLNWKGYSLKVMARVAAELGFEWEVGWRGSLDQAQALWGAETFTELAANAVNVFDLIGSFWVDNSERRAAGLLISHHFVDTSGVLMVATTAAAEESLLDTMWTAFEPFDWTVWVAIVVLLAVQGLISAFLDVPIRRAGNKAGGEKAVGGGGGGKDDEQGGEREGRGAYVARYLENSYGHFAATGHGLEPASGPNKLHAIVWGFVVVAVLAAYTANLATFLISEAASTESLESLEQANADGIEVCVQAGSVYETWLKSNGYSDIPLHRAPSTTALGDAVAYGKYTNDDGAEVSVSCQGAFLGQSEADMAMATHCGYLTLVGAAYFSAGGGYAMSPYGCGSLLLSAFDLALLQLDADGTLETEWENAVTEYADGIDCVDSEAESTEDESDSTKLTFSHMGGLFALYIISAALLVVARGAQWYWYKHGGAAAKHIASRAPSPFSSTKNGTFRDSTKENGHFTWEASSQWVLPQQAPAAQTSVAELHRYRSPKPKLDQRPNPRLQSVTKTEGERQMNEVEDEERERSFSGKTMGAPKDPQDINSGVLVSKQSLSNLKQFINANKLQVSKNQ